MASSGGELNLPRWPRTGKLKDFYKTELKRTGKNNSCKNYIMVYCVTLGCAVASSFAGSTS